MPVSRMALRSVLRIPPGIVLSTLVVLMAVAAPAPDARSVIFVMGPSAGNPGVQAARSAAFACRRWLKEPGATAELRRAGSSGSVALDKVAGKDLDNAFLAAAKDSVDRDPADLISTLDDAVHALANRPGLRIAVAILDAAPLPSDVEESLRQIVEYSADNSIRLVLLDPSKASIETSGEIWKLAGSTTSGAFIQDSRTLTSAMLVASGVKPTAADTPPASPSAAPPSAKTSAVAPGLPVYVRFIQISNRSRSAQDRVMEPINTGLANSINNQDGGTLGAEASSGPMHGYLIAQAPLSGLRFEQDAGNYSAHAVITQIVRNADGKIVWHADKDVKIGGPLAKLKERQAGNLYLMRDVLLPGGQFTLEASVQDLLAKKTSNISEPLKTGASVPGLRISDAMFVKAYHGNVDRFEADMVFNYEGYAIAPMLGPVFPANTPFKVELYFIIYPDVSGPPIGITLEILQGGKVVASASMPFKSALRNNIESQKGSAVSSERVHGFDYLASLDVAKMSASDCQARLTVRQGKNVVTRLVDFTVAGTTAMAQKSTDAKTAN